MNYKEIKLADIPKIARELLTEYSENRIFVFDAPMGAGKTTLITQMCHYLGVGDEVASPTFAIVNVYQGKEFSEIYHFDFTSILIQVIIVLSNGPILLKTICLSIM